MDTEPQRSSKWLFEHERCADFTLRVWGDRAAFKRYDTPAEAQTYPMVTPAAAHGILSSIYWHPGVHYDVTCLCVLHPVQVYVTLGNEINKHAGRGGMDIGHSGNRTQRYREVISRPAYLISARVVVGGMHSREEYQAERGKALGIFTRRAANGQCHERPYLGLREYAANFEPATQGDVPWDADADLGPVPLRLHKQPFPGGPLQLDQYEHDPDVRKWNKVRCEGRAVKSFMEGIVRRGMMPVPFNFGSELLWGA